MKMKSSLRGLCIFGCLMVAMNMAAGEPVTQYTFASAYNRYTLSTNNFAKGMYTNQISTHDGGSASLAVDGIFSYYWSSRSMSHTGKYNNPWWEVQFGRVEIGKIVLALRYDRHMSKYRRYIKVSIYDGGQEVWSNEQGNHDPGAKLTLHPRENDQRPFILGDRVRVWNMQRDFYLTLGEVECYAMVAPNPNNYILDYGGTNGMSIVKDIFKGLQKVPATSRPIPFLSESLDHFLIENCKKIVNIAFMELKKNPSITEFVRAVNAALKELFPFMSTSRCGGPSNNMLGGMFVKSLELEPLSESSSPLERINRIGLDFCIGGKRPTSVHGTRLRGSNIFITGDKHLPVEYNLSFGVTLHNIYNSVSVQSITIIRGSANVDTRTEMSLSAGMIELDVDAQLQMGIDFSISNCVSGYYKDSCESDALNNNRELLNPGSGCYTERDECDCSITESDCDQNEGVFSDDCPNCPGEKNQNYRFYLKAMGSYTLTGSGSIVGDESTVGIDDELNISIHDKGCFGDDPEEVDIGLDFGLLDFSGHDAVSFIRVIDKAIVHAQENEVFMHQNVPMLNVKVSDVIQTGSIFTRHLYKYFVKIQEFTNREKKSLSLSSSTFVDDFTQKSADLVFILIRSDITIDPENGVALRELASESENVHCGINLDHPKNANAMVEQITISLRHVSCGLTVCQKDECESSGMEDFLACDCDLVVDEKNGMTFIATTAYKDSDNSVENDVRLISIIPADTQPTETKLRAFNFGFSLNHPSTVEFIPIISSIDGFSAGINQSIEATLGTSNLENLNVEISLKDGVDGQQDWLHLKINFDFEKFTGVSIDPLTFNLENFYDVELISTDILLSSQVQMKTEFGIVLGPSKVKSLKLVTKSPCRHFKCDGSFKDLNYELRYRMIGESDETTIVDTITFSADGDYEFTDKLMKSKLKDIIMTIEERGYNTLVLTFNPDVAMVEIIPLHRRCKYRNGEIEEFSGLCTDYGLEFVNVLPNPFGFHDVVLNKDPVQIRVGEFSIESQFNTKGDLQINADIERMIEARLEMQPDIHGNLDLIIKPSQTGFADYNEYLGLMVSINTNQRTPGFFNVNSEVSGTISGTVEVDKPFDSLSSDFSGSLQPFNMFANFKNSGSEHQQGEDSLPAHERELLSLSLPQFQLLMRSPALEGIGEFSPEDIPLLLSTFLDILVGPSITVQSALDALKACSGGMFGIDIGGVDVFQFKIPGIGIRLCDAVQFIVPIVEAIEQIKKEYKAGQLPDLMYLETNIAHLLSSTLGGSQNVSIIPSENDHYTNIELSITLKHMSNMTSRVNIDLEQYITASGLDESTAATIELFSNGLVPVDSGAEINYMMDSEFHVVVGMEYDKRNHTKSLYMKDNTGVRTSLLADAKFDFHAQIGPFEGNVNGTMIIGEPESPIEFSASFSGVVGNSEDSGAAKIYLTGPNSVTTSSMLNSMNYNGLGSLTINVNAEMGIIFFDSDPPGVQLASSFDMEKFISDKEDAFSTSVVTSGNIFSELPSIVDILSMNAEGVIEILDQIFSIVEESIFGKEGIITTFLSPFIGKKVGNSLGAGSENNVIRSIRNAIIPTLREGLTSVADEEDRANIARVLASIMQQALSEYKLLQHGKEVDVLCYDTERNVTSCSDGTPASFIWIIPMGQEIVVPMDLDFDIDSTAFPFLVQLSNGDDTTLSVEWGYTLGFGIDIDTGLFLCTFDELPESEFSVISRFDVKGVNVDTTFGLLNANITNLDISMASALFVDLVGPDYTMRGTDIPGRLTVHQLRRLNQPLDLFQITAVAGATISSSAEFYVSFGEGGGIFSQVGNAIPRFKADIVAQAYKRIGEMKEPDRRNLLSTTNHRKLLNEEVDETLDILRWLSAEDSSSDTLIGHGYGGEWAACPVTMESPLCAKVKNVELDISSFRDALPAMLHPITNKDRTGYMDRVTKDFEFLTKSISDFIGKDIINDDTTLLEYAGIFCSKCNPDSITRLLELYRRLQKLQESMDDFMEATGNIALADECDFLNGLRCVKTVVDQNLKNRVIFPKNIDQSVKKSDKKKKNKKNKKRTLASRCDINCEGCPDAIGYLKCSVSAVEGLLFPFLDDPSKIITLLSGSHIDLIRFEPPEVSFGWEGSIPLTLSLAPYIELILTADFTCRFKYGVVLSTQGIQEAIEENSPIKATNAFALIDKFNGVDEPLVRITASMGASLVVKALFAQASATGKLMVAANIDFYDPYPDTSNGLVRPYELITLSTNPQDWIEYSVESSWYFRIDVNIGWFFNWHHEKKNKLFPSIHHSPILETRILHCDTETRGLTLLAEISHADQVLVCTGLYGQSGNETIECERGSEMGVDESPQFQKCNRVSHIESEVSHNKSAHFNLMLRDIQSPTNLTSFGTLRSLELDYSKKGQLIVAGDSILLGDSFVDLGEVSLNFDPTLEKGVFRMPVPEQQTLYTTISSECDSAWDIIGYTNLIVNMNKIADACVVKATGGLMTDFAKLMIDLSDDSPGKGDLCVEGEETLLIIEEIEDGLLHVHFGDGKKSVTVDQKFGDIELELSSCDDLVHIRSMPGFVKSVTVYGHDGNDVVTVGTDEFGLDLVRSSIFVEGHHGNINLIVNDKGASAPVQSSKLTSASMEGLIPGDGGLSISYKHVQELSLVLPSVGNNQFDINSIGVSVIRTSIIGSSTDSVSVNSDVDGLVLTGIPSTSSNVPPGGGSLRGGSETPSLNSIETMFSEILSRTSMDDTSSDNFIDVSSDTLNQDKGTSNGWLSRK